MKYIIGFTIFFLCCTASAQERKINSNTTRQKQAPIVQTKPTARAIAVKVTQPTPDHGRLKKLVPRENNSTKDPLKSELLELGHIIYALRESNPNSSDLTKYRASYISISQQIGEGNLNEEEHDLFIYCFKIEQPALYESNHSN